MIRFDMSLLVRMLTSFSFVLLLSAVTLAQTGRVEGTVVDQDGEPLVGVNVLLEGTTRGATTSIDGDYFILNVRPGEYTLLVSYIGFHSQRIQNVQVAVDRTTRIDVEMTEETLEMGEIVISAQTSMVTMDRTSSSAKISQVELLALPVDNFTQAVALQAGVNRGQDGALHIRGGRSSEVQYYVDGVAVSNPFNFGMSVPVENTAVQEIEVISGSFNAEFGQANSGIINIVTKEGGEQFEGTFIAGVGGYLSNRTDLYRDIDNANLYDNRNFEGSLSGPTPISGLTFFTSGAYSRDGGWLFGREVFLPSDSASFSGPPDMWSIPTSGDSSVVRMNDNENYSFLGKLTWQVTRDLKVSYSYTRARTDANIYRHRFRLNPGHVPGQFSRNHNHLLAINHVLNNRTFYNLRLTANLTDFGQYVFENPLDPRYRDRFGRGNQPQQVFNTGGLDNEWLNRKSYTYAARFDISRFIGNTHLVKTGVEYRWNLLRQEHFFIQVDPRQFGDYTPRIPEPGTRNNNNYRRTPVEFSAYIQDKIEIDDLIINAGLRFDYFNANSLVPTDLRDPSNRLRPREDSEAFKDASPKMQLSPRLGFAFPITARGVIYASYGQFFQIPQFLSLYENPDFNVTGGSFNTMIGNADLEAQRSVLYEIGLQQELHRTVGLDLVVYHRDVRNLLGTGLYATYTGGDSYGRFENNDFGTVRGFTAALTFRDRQSGIYGNLNYTYQSVKGNGSDPRQAFFDAQGLTEATSVLVPLDWDQRHNITANLTLITGAWSFGAVAQYRTGYPFTPEDERRQPLVELRNDARRISEVYLDMRVARVINVGDLSIQTFFQGENLLDFIRDDRFPKLFQSEIRAHRDNGLERVNTLEELLNNPIVQPRPRSLRIGMQVQF